MVDLEVLSAHAQGDANKLLGRFAALLVFISVWTALGALGYAGAPMAPPAALALQLVTSQFLISTTMLMVGLFTVLSWDSTFPDRRDVLVLSPLPVRARTMFLAKVAAAVTSLLVSVGLLHGAMGLVWPFAFAAHATPQTIPALTADPTPNPVSAANLQTVLTHDLKTNWSKGTLAPGAGGGLTVGVWKRGDSRVFGYGAAKPDSLFEIGSITKTFTGLMLAQMVVQGKVTLDEPIRLLLPPGTVSTPRNDEITLIDIASQHSDLPRTVPGDWMEFLSRRGVRKQPHPPFQYSNFAFGVDGATARQPRRSDVSATRGEGSHRPARPGQHGGIAFARATETAHPGVRRGPPTGAAGPGGIGRRGRDCLHRRRPTKVPGGQHAPGDAPGHSARGHDPGPPPARRRTAAHRHLPGVVLYGGERHLVA